MKLTPKITGLLQAIGLTLYIELFAVAARQFQRFFILKNSAPHPILGITLFLLAFVFSALICGSIVFLRPISLFLENKKYEAIKTIIWTAAWLLALFIVFLAMLGFIVAPK